MLDILIKAAALGFFIAWAAGIYLVIVYLLRGDHD